MNEYYLCCVFTSVCVLLVLTLTVVIYFFNFFNFFNFFLFFIQGLLPSGEIASLKSIFEEFDEDKDGTLTVQELRKGLERKLLENKEEQAAGKMDENGRPLTPRTQNLRQTSVSDAQIFLESLDADGDGVVNIEEFVAGKRCFIFISI